MAYKQITIREMVMKHLNVDTFLPAIQREYVWDPKRIETLFDSLMSLYPIGTFLFWKIDNKDNMKDRNKKIWDSYEFIHNFDAENPHNNEANLNGIDNALLVLDGQQRLTSLYIALRGYYLQTKYNKPHRLRLYIKLSYINELNKEERHEEDEMNSITENQDDTPILKYKFLFRDENADKDNDFWYEVGKILDLKNDSEISSLSELSGLEKKDEAVKILTRLYHVINDEELINYYELEADNCDDIVQVFVRTNKGGKQLEYSDILLSTATATWDTNAREKILDFTDEINKIGPNFGFTKDFVLKAAMYLTEGVPIKYALSSFSAQNLKKIEGNWNNTKEAIRDTVKFVSSFMTIREALIAKNVLLPVAFYLSTRKARKLDIKTDDNAENIRKWIYLVLLSGTMGSSSDTKLSDMRSVIKENKSAGFPWEELNKKLGLKNKADEERINWLLNRKYKSGYSYLVLSLLYDEGTPWTESYAQDHIYPKSKMEKNSIDEKWNTLVNLEILDSPTNSSKNDKEFTAWKDILEEEKKWEKFKKTNLIPDLDDYSKFDDFVQKRSELLKKELQNLALNKTNL